MAKKIYTSANEELEILQYIESTGTQYIDTNFKHNEKTRVVIDFEITTHKNWGNIFGSFGGASGSNKLMFLGMNDQESFYSHFGGDSTSFTMSSVGKFSVDYNKNILTINNTSHTFTTSTFQSEFNLLLFGVTGYTGTVSMAPTGVKIYFCQIYDNDVLVRDFIPVLDEQGKACLYDKITQRKFLNKGTGDFSFGRIQGEVEYLESTGTQYIDTGVVPASTQVEVKFAFTSTSGDQQIIGCYTGTDAVRFYPAMISGTSIATVGGNWDSGRVYYAPLDTNIHTVLYNDANNKIFFDGVQVATAQDYTGSKTTKMGMFCRYSTGTTVEIPAKARIYYCKITDKKTGTLIRDYVPYIDSNNVPCMLDKANNKCYYNAGTGVFLTGQTLEEEKIEIKNSSREVKTMYTAIPSQTTIIKNIFPTIEGLTCFTSLASDIAGTVEASSTYAKYATEALKISITADQAEGFIMSNDSNAITLNPNHTYYGRVEVYQETAHGGVGVYWPVMEPPFISQTVGEANQWNMYSAVMKRDTFEAGNWKFRLDLDNNGSNMQASSAWFDGLMMIDLTDTFGVGNEPTKEWCDENIPFFRQTMEIERPKIMGLSKIVKKGYIGVDGVAKMFYTTGSYLKKKEIDNAPASIAAGGAMATVGDYMISAGGYYTNAVYAWDTKLKCSAITSLSVARGTDGQWGCSNDNYAVFAGGASASATWSTVVDTYNKDLVRSTASALSAARGRIASARVGEYVIFAGGCGSGSTYISMANVDAYNNSMVKTSITTLTKGTQWATGAGNSTYAIFTGGVSVSTGKSFNQVDAYNKSLTKSTPTSLATNTQCAGAATIADTMLICGGNNYQGSSSDTYLNKVETYSNTLTRGTATSLSKARRQPFCASNGDYLLVGGGYIDSSNYTDITDCYNTSLVKTDVEKFTKARVQGMATSNGKYILVTGGYGGGAVIEAYKTW